MFSISFKIPFHTVLKPGGGIRANRNALFPSPGKYDVKEIDGNHASKVCNRMLKLQYERRTNSIANHKFRE